MGKADAKWYRPLIQSLLGRAVWGVLAMIGATLLARLGSTWTHPLLEGLLGGLLVFAILVAAKALSLMPPSNDRVTSDNIEEKVLGWLHRSNLGVRKSSNDQTFFRFIVTTESDRRILIARPKQEFMDYIHLQAEVVPTEKDKEILAKLSKSDADRLLLNLKLELARP